MFGCPETFLLKTIGAIDMPPAVAGYSTIRVKPDALQWALPGAMSGSLSNFTAPSFASASLHTVRGTVAVQWRVKNTNFSTCAVAEEGQMAHLSCGVGGNVTHVRFAVYGTRPAAATNDWTCPNLKGTNPKCATTAATMSAVEKLCVGKPDCSIPVETDTFGGVDPCLGTKKTLAVAVECGAPVHSLATATVSATIPPTALGEIWVPMLANATVVNEGGTNTVWRNGAFVKDGSEGVFAAHAQGKYVVFETVAGSYSFSA